MHLGYLASLGTLFCWTISVFLLGRLSRLSHPWTLNKISLLYSAVLLGLLVCVKDSLSPYALMTKPSISQWTWLGLSGILGKTLGDFFGYNCIRILGVRRRSMITTITPAFTWFFAFQWLGEKINVIGLTGIFMTIFALFSIYKDQDEAMDVQQDAYGTYLKGISMGIAGAALTGIAFVISKKAYHPQQESISEFHGTWIRVIAALVVVLMIDLFRKEKEPTVHIFLKNKSTFLLLTGAVVFGTILGLSFSLVAITHLPVAVAYTIFAMVPLMVMIIEVITGKTRIKQKQWVLAILAIIGVCILLWRNHVIPEAPSEALFIRSPEKLNPNCFQRILPLSC
ncbi:MAG: DMT family transporter [Chitinophagaceae bacterium]